MHEGPKIGLQLVENLGKKNELDADYLSTPQRPICFVEWVTPITLKHRITRRFRCQRMFVKPNF